MVTPFPPTDPARLSVSIYAVIDPAFVVVQRFRPVRWKAKIPSQGLIRRFSPGTATCVPGRFSEVGELREPGNTWNFNGLSRLRNLPDD